MTIRVKKLITCSVVSIKLSKLSAIRVKKNITKKKKKRNSVQIDSRVPIEWLNLRKKNSNEDHRPEKVKYC